MNHDYKLIKDLFYLSRVCAIIMLLHVILQWSDILYPGFLLVIGLLNLFCSSIYEIVRMKPQE